MDLYNNGVMKNRCFNNITEIRNNSNIDTVVMLSLKINQTKPMF